MHIGTVVEDCYGIVWIYSHRFAVQRASCTVVRRCGGRSPQRSVDCPSIHDKFSCNHALFQLDVRDTHLGSVPPDASTSSSAACLAAPIAGFPLGRSVPCVRCWRLLDGSHVVTGVIDDVYGVNYSNGGKNGNPMDDNAEESHG